MLVHSISLVLAAVISQTFAAISELPIYQGHPLGDGRWTLGLPPGLRAHVSNGVGNEGTYIQTYDLDVDYAATCPTTAPQPRYADEKQFPPSELDYETKRGKPVQTEVSFKIDLWSQTVTVEGFGSLMIEEVGISATIWPHINVDIRIKASCFLRWYEDCCEGFVDLNVGLRIDQEFEIRAPAFNFKQVCNPMWSGIPTACELARHEIPGLPAKEDCSIDGNVWTPSAPPMPGYMTAREKLDKRLGRKQEL
ncbi:uncharacterized protein L969DRAFT_16171 [Mixia osmundae IAM 14324]|uniref:Uncharacterized protein n=1 Tax=Mixia osmundae (strain CBS 9802 / IAM 14324 / JCM 22182 / KY 12970) TaxID=764103 RepID=G7E5C6_MIXOS|nr:uncharacterized protein L969DRAFT_16171 [Mixia osmundae IAM 14324]KEI40811.1 hypothetical protein L969DRAFT_16171 [Mixia osmundae IAM 14324]GAA98036.1 hypothetical protein E5Q_04717 [Mixia osmundae IAM 14324]